MSGAFSGEADAGFPKENETKYEFVDRFPVQPNRKPVWKPTSWGRPGSPTARNYKGPRGALCFRHGAPGRPPTVPAGRVLLSAASTEQEVVGLQLVGVQAKQAERAACAEVDGREGTVVGHQRLQLGKAR